MAHTKVFKFVSTLRFPSNNINTRTIPGCVLTALWLVGVFTVVAWRIVLWQTQLKLNTHTHIVIHICFVHTYIKNKHGVHKILRKGPTHLHTKMQPQIQIKVWSITTQQKARHVMQVYKNSLLAAPYALHQHNSDFWRNTLNKIDKKCNRSHLANKP